MKAIAVCLAVGLLFLFAFSGFYQPMKGNCCTGLTHQGACGHGTKDCCNKGICGVMFFLQHLWHFGCSAHIRFTQNQFYPGKTGFLIYDGQFLVFFRFRLAPQKSFLVNSKRLFLRSTASVY